MNDLIYIAIISLLLLTIVFSLIKNKSFFKEKTKPRMLLTHSEYKMYFVLKKALPDCQILVQVGFAAMLQAKNREIINRFLAKRADYVICDQLLNILLIIELDDWSHKGREREDKAREKLLTDAGYKVLRFQTIPEPTEARKIISKVIEVV